MKLCNVSATSVELFLYMYMCSVMLEEGKKHSKERAFDVYNGSIAAFLFRVVYLVSCPQVANVLLQVLLVLLAQSCSEVSHTVTYCITRCL